MLTRTLKMAFWVMYDHIGKLMVANLLWSLVIAVPGSVAATSMLYGDAGVRLLVGVPAFVVTAGVVMPVMSAGMAHMVKALIDRKDGSLGDMFSGIATYWRRSIGVGLAYLLILACLTTSAWFYAEKLKSVAPFAGYAISALAVWCLVFAGIAALMVMPALVQKRAGVVATLKLAALLVLDNPLLMLGLAIHVALVTAIMLAIWPAFFFLYGTTVTVLASSAYELLARKYAQVEMGGASRFRAQTLMEEEDKEDDYLNRGVRDAFFPWKN